MMKQWFTGISLLVFIGLFSTGIAEANGTLKFKFHHKDANGVETILPYGMVYLQDGTKDPPMEKFFTKPLYMLWGSYGASDLYLVSVPAGTYYIRITQRNNPIPTQYLGPPRLGDYTWRQVVPITITDNTVIDLGTIYPSMFGQITVSGTVQTPSGTPLAGKFIRAQSVPCYTDGYNGNINRCGSDKYLALQETDAAGNYTLVLRTPGTYYLYITPCLGDKHQEYTGNPCVGTLGGTITVQAGESKDLNMIGR